jgi:hypothetical protein
MPTGEIVSPRIKDGSHSKFRPSAVGSNKLIIDLGYNMLNGISAEFHPESPALWTL